MLTRSKATRLGTGGTILSLCLMLVACDDINLHGEFELGFDGLNLLVATCEEAEVAEVHVSEYVRESDGSSSRRVWEASGSFLLGAGAALVVRGDNPGLENDLVEPPAPREGIQYYVKFNDMPERVSSALFVWPDGGMSDGQWLTTDGEIRSNACDAG